MGNITALKPRSTGAREEVAASVRAFIARAGVSKSAVAREIGMTQPTFSRRANGQEPFDTDEMGALAEYFGVTLAELVSGRIESIAPNAKKAPTPKGGGQSVHPLGLEPRTHWIRDEHVTPIRPIGRRDRSTGPKRRAA